MEKELLKSYIYYFGNKPPFPPKQIMESLVRMKDNGTFDKKLKVVSQIGDKVKSKIEKISKDRMTINHRFFDEKFNK